MSRSVTIGTFRTTVFLGGLISVTGTTKGSPSRGLPSACRRIETAGGFCSAPRATTGRRKIARSLSMAGMIFIKKGFATAVPLA